jgi:plastocyanin
MRTSWAVLVAAMVCAAGCGSSSVTEPTDPGSGGGTTRTVRIEGDAYLPGGSAAFAPSEINVTLGTTVMWQNSDQTQHTVSSDSGVWSSTVAALSSFSRQFTTAGTFQYHCSIHPAMTGTVTVE